MKLQIIFKKPNELIAYVKNAREHSTDQINLICKSINEFGFSNPILIDVNNNVIAGHGRLAAAKQLKLKEVPVIILENLTDVQVKALRLADNKIALNSSWNYTLLAEELKFLESSDLSLDVTGFSDDEIKDILSGLDDIDVPSTQSQANGVTDPTAGKVIVMCSAMDQESIKRYLIQVLKDRGFIGFEVK